MKSRRAQFIRQDGFVDGFQEPRAKSSVDSKSSIDNLFGDGILIHSLLF